ncbi:MAG TPA: CehA/McbA family metallohydrolase [Verrucomicrobiae bacterium]|nr:CehA/McbA family metallohydrolase [Verrucomicrobiae bacterium]
MSTAGLTHRLHLGPAEKEISRYQYLPVPVDAPVPGLTVQLRYDHSIAVIDLGLVGPGGFRGWSGGERDQITVGPRAATPGYLPGPIEAGQWSVVLGLYKVPLGGVDVEVAVRRQLAPLPPLPPPPPPPPVRPPDRPPARPGWRWVPGDLHSHTVHSDGRLSIDQLAALARSRGLEFLAVTDHNTVSHHPHLASASLRYGLTLICGQELTTDQGHANCLGDVGWVDFRESADRWQEQADAAGGLISINHPVAGPMGWRRPMRRRPQLVEAWHVSWDRRDPRALAWWRAGGGGVVVGGSDFHRRGNPPPGTPTTWVEVPADGAGPPPAERVLDGLRDGRVAVAAGPRGPAMVRSGDELEIRGGDGLRLVAEDGARRAVVGDRARLTAPPGLWRLEAPDGVVCALSR